MSIFRFSWVRALNKALRLRGPAADSHTAQVLHALLLGLLAMNLLAAVAFLPTVILAPKIAAVLIVLGSSFYLAALVQLNRGNERLAGVTYLAGILTFSTLLVGLSGGVRSAGLVMFVACIMSTAWILGLRETIAVAAYAIFVTLAMAIGEIFAGPFPRYLPESALSVWGVFLVAVVTSLVPVLRVLTFLQGVLATNQKSVAELSESQTALRRERDVLKRVLETSPVGLAAFDKLGKVTFANSPAKRIFGITRAERQTLPVSVVVSRMTTLDGQPMREEDRPFVQMKASGTPVRDSRFAVTRPGGDQVLISVNATPLFSEEGEFEGAVESIDDVTEQVQAEEELRRYREHLEHMVKVRTEELSEARDRAISANRAKTDFLANVSHELRTPLNAILGFSGLLRSGTGLSRSQFRQIDSIQRSGQHLLQLIDDLLDIARIEAGHRDLNPRPCDLTSLIVDVVDMVRVRADAAGLVVTVFQSPQLPRRVLIDDAKLRQILLNLLSNAVQYTDRGTVSLLADAAPAGDDDSVVLRLQVADTGRGLAQEDQLKIFEPFTRLRTAAAGPGGTGLGLTITRQFVEAMGGEIRVESKVGVGSVFLVTIPCRLAAPAASDSPEVDSYKIHLAPGQPDYKVLVVDDDEENRVVLSQLVGNAGFQFRTAVDGADAIRVFQEWQPQFIWMDLRMPGMDGIEATARIRGLPHGTEVRIAAVTASPFDRDRTNLESAGLDDVVLKPVRPAEIFRCMAAQLGVTYDTPLGQAAEVPPVPSPLTPSALANLPWEMRADLGQAVLALNARAIEDAISRISAHDPASGRALAVQAKRFAYTAILHALKGQPTRINTAEEPSRPG